MNVFRLICVGTFLVPVLGCFFGRQGNTFLKEKAELACYRQPKYIMRHSRRPDFSRAFFCAILLVMPDQSRRRRDAIDYIETFDEGNFLLRASGQQMESMLTENYTIVSLSLVYKPFGNTVAEITNIRTNTDEEGARRVRRAAMDESDLTTVDLEYTTECSNTTSCVFTGNYVMKDNMYALVRLPRSPASKKPLPNKTQPKKVTPQKVMKPAPSKPSPIPTTSKPTTTKPATPKPTTTSRPTTSSSTTTTTRPTTTPPKVTTTTKKPTTTAKVASPTTMTSNASSVNATSPKATNSSAKGGKSKTGKANNSTTTEEGQNPTAGIDDAKPAESHHSENTEYVPVTAEQEAQKPLTAAKGPLTETPTPHSPKPSEKKKKLKEKVSKKNTTILTNPKQTYAHDPKKGKNTGTGKTFEIQPPNIAAQGYGVIMQILGGVFVAVSAVLACACKFCNLMARMPGCCKKNNTQRVKVDVVSHVPPSVEMQNVHQNK